MHFFRQRNRNSCIYSRFDCEVFFCLLKFSPFFKLERFCRLWNKNNNGVPLNLAYAPPLFQHVFVPNTCNSDDDDDDGDDDDNINVFVMMMIMMMIVIMVKMLMR